MHFQPIKPGVLPSAIAGCTRCYNMSLLLFCFFFLFFSLRLWSRATIQNSCFLVVFPKYMMLSNATTHAAMMLPASFSPPLLSAPLANAYASDHHASLGLFSRLMKRNAGKVPNFFVAEMSRDDAEALLVEYGRHIDGACVRVCFACVAAAANRVRRILLWTVETVVLCCTLYTGKRTQPALTTLECNI